MVVEKDMFKEEVERILEQVSGKAANDLKDKLDKAYDLANKLHVFGEQIDRTGQELADEILEYLFKDKFSQSYSIPMEFIEGPVGKVVFSLKLGIAESVYTTAEIIVIMNITRALISHDLKNGLVMGMKKGRNIIIYERDLIRYMQSKKMGKDEIKLRLSLYAELVNKGLGEEKLAQAFQDEFSKRKKMA